MKSKNTIGYVFVAGMTAVIGGMVGALVYANKLIEKENEKRRKRERDSMVAEEPENSKDDTVN